MLCLMKIRKIVFGLQYHRFTFYYSVNARVRLLFNLLYQSRCKSFMEISPEYRDPKMELAHCSLLAPNHIDLSQSSVLQPTSVTCELFVRKWTYAKSLQHGQTSVPIVSLTSPTDRDSPVSATTFRDWPVYVYPSALWSFGLLQFYRGFLGDLCLVFELPGTLLCHTSIRNDITEMISEVTEIGQFISRSLSSQRQYRRDGSTGCPTLRPVRTDVIIGSECTKFFRVIVQGLHVTCALDWVWIGYLPRYCPEHKEQMMWLKEQRCACAPTQYDLRVSFPTMCSVTKVVLRFHGEFPRYCPLCNHNLWNGTIHKEHTRHLHLLPEILYAA